MLPAVALCAQAQTSRIRVYTVRPDSVDYVFTAVVSSSEPPMLSFNDRRNKTHFVRVGERLGMYLVEAFMPGTEKFFDESVGVYREAAAGVVMLRGPDNEVFTLEQDARTPAPGFRAVFISLDTGEVRDARENEVVTLAGTELKTKSISEESVVAAAGGTEDLIPFISDEEKEAVLALLARRREEAENRRRIAARQREKEEAAKRLQELEKREAALKALERNLRLSQAAAPAPRTSMFVGSEQAYPTVYQSYYDRHGRLVYYRTVYPIEFMLCPWKYKRHSRDRRGSSYPGGVYFETGDINVGGVNIRAKGAIGSHPQKPVSPAPHVGPSSDFGQPGNAPAFPWP